MNDQNNFNIEELDQMLRPQCEFHASDGLKSKILQEAEASQRSSLRRYVPWIAAAACVALVVSIAISPYDENRVVESFIPQEKQISINSQISMITDQNNADQTSNTTKESPDASKNNQNHLNETPRNQVPASTSKRNQVSTSIFKSTQEYSSVTTSTQESPLDYSTDNRQQTTDNSLVFAMISESGPELIAMTPSPEEIIRRQEESIIEYIEYMRQEIEYAQQLSKQLYETNQISLSHE